MNWGTVVAIGSAPQGIDHQLVTGEVVRFEGNGRVSAVVLRDDAGNETTHPCDTVALGLGLHPRNALHKMGADLPVHAVGEAAIEATVPLCPSDPESTICACSAVSLADLDYTWESGFREMELIKRSTLGGHRRLPRDGLHSLSAQFYPGAWRTNCRNALPPALSTAS